MVVEHEEPHRVACPEKLGSTLVPFSFNRTGKRLIVEGCDVFLHGFV